MGESVSIFILESYNLTRTLLKRHLSKENDFKITGEFGTVKDCLGALNECRPDIIITELDLPDSNGIIAIKAIKEKYPDIKIIVFTTHETKEEVDLCITAGVSGYILKDCSFETIKDAITVIALNGRWFDPQIVDIPKLFSRDCGTSICKMPG